MVYEGDGSIFVNGVHYGEYFKSYVDRMNVMIPFLVTDMDRKMNAWCTVEGGGSSGQSGPFGWHSINRHSFRICTPTS